MQLAHDKAPVIAAQVSSDLFAWNHVDVSQFTLVDPSGIGWSLEFVAASDVEPEHLALIAPKAWSQVLTPAYVLVDMPASDYDISIIHNSLPFPNEVGVLARYIGPGDFFSSRLRRYQSLIEVNVYARENDIDSRLLEKVDALTANDETLFDLRLSARKNLIGGGLGRVAQLKNFSPSSGSLLVTDRTVGFGFFHGSFYGSKKTGGEERVKIYDFTVRAK